MNASSSSPFAPPLRLASLDGEAPPVGKGYREPREAEADRKRSCLDHARAERLVKPRLEIAVGHAAAVNQSVDPCHIAETKSL